MAVGEEFGRLAYNLSDSDKVVAAISSLSSIGFGIDLRAILEKMHDMLVLLWQNDQPSRFYDWAWSAEFRRNC